MPKEMQDHLAQLLREKREPRLCGLGSGFYPVQHMDAHVSAVEAALEHNYGKLRSKPGSKGEYSWDAMCARRKGRYGYIEPAEANRILISRATEAQRLIALRCDVVGRGDGRLDAKCIELERVRNETCGDPNAWEHRSSNTPVSYGGRRDLPGEALMGSSGRTFLLGMMDDLLRTYIWEPMRYIVMPFSDGHVFRTETSWNLMANIAMVSCAMQNSAARFPLRFILPYGDGWEKQLRRDKPDTTRSSMQYVGTLLLRFDKVRSSDYEYCSFSPDQGEGCPVLPYGVFYDPTALNSPHRPDPFYVPYMLINVNGERVDWGDFTGRKRVTYFEVRQMMARIHHDTENTSHLYQLVTPHSPEHHQHWLFSRLSPAALVKDLRQDNLDATLAGNDIISFTTGQLSGYTMRNVKLTWTDVQGDLRLSSAISQADAETGPPMDVTKFKNLYYSSAGGMTTASRMLPSYERYLAAIRAIGTAVDGGSRPLDVVYTTTEIGRPKGLQPYHISPDGGVFVNGLKQPTRNLTTSANFITPHGRDCVPLAVKLIGGSTDSKRLIQVIALNANMAEAFLHASSGANVHLLLLGAKNVAPLDRLAARHPSRLSLHTVGLLMASPRGTQPPIPPGPRHDVVVLDVESVWHGAKAANTALATLSQLPNVLRADGRAAMMITLPDTADGVMMRALSLWAGAFKTFEVIALPRVSHVAAVVVIFEGFRGLLSASSEASARGIRTALLDGMPIPPVVAPNFVSPNVVSAVESAYDASTDALLPKATKSKRQSRQNVAVSKQAPPPSNDGLPLSFRGLQLVRRFEDETGGSYPYAEDARDFEPRCHWGQLKLHLSEWDFLNRTRDLWSTRPTVVVYAGAADGAHTPLLADLFPEVHRWFLFDGAPFAPGVLRHPRIRAFTGDAGFVTDATVPTFARLAKEEGAKAILFISDIRTVPSETRVKEDMVSQARWGIRLGADAMLLKFRPPYTRVNAADGQKVATVPSASPADFASPDPTTNKLPPPLIVVNNDVPEARRSLYLDGEVQPQLFAPLNSTETRLYVRRHPDGTYPLRFYDVVRHEEESYFYNLTTRRLLLPSHEPALDLYLPGFDHGWESAQAYRIAREYVETRPGAGLPLPPPTSSSSTAVDDRRAVRVLGHTIERLRHVTGSGHGLSYCLSETLGRYAGKRGRPGQGPPPHQVRRIALWRRIVGVQEEEMVALQRRRILRHAVVDGVFTRTEAEALVASTAYRAS